MTFEYVGYHGLVFVWAKSLSALLDVWDMCCHAHLLGRLLV